MLYIGYLIILDGQSIKKNQLREFSIFELPTPESCISRLCTPAPLRAPPPPPPHPNRVKNT